LDDLGPLAEKVLAAARPYQFDTFLIGATLPTQLFEREDALRARLKIRGRESIKTQLTRELGAKIAKMTGKKADYMRPDLAINLVIDKDGWVEATARARPLAVAGRYVKKERGLPQKQEKCPMCLGKGGCNLCDNTGLAMGVESVEGVIARHLVLATQGHAPKFSWVGSEDRDSLVLGRGRPFYAKISDPKVRRPKLRFRESGVEARITAVLDDDVPVVDVQARFITKTRIGIKCDDRPATAGDAKKLRSALAGSEVKFRNRSKMAAKKIYSVQARKTGDNTLSLTVTADGGLPIKQFVGGEEYIEPSVSQLLGAKCECTTFDVLAVDLIEKN
jgi:tRNA pseudouridine synthase 10